MERKNGKKGRKERKRGRKKKKGDRQTAAAHFASLPLSSGLSLGPEFGRSSPHPLSDPVSPWSSQAFHPMEECSVGRVLCVFTMSLSFLIIEM